MVRRHIVMIVSNQPVEVSIDDPVDNHVSFTMEIRTQQQPGQQHHQQQQQIHQLSCIGNIFRSRSHCKADKGGQMRIYSMSGCVHLRPLLDTVHTFRFRVDFRRRETSRSKLHIFPYFSLF